MYLRGIVFLFADLAVAGVSHIPLVPRLFPPDLAAVRILDPLPRLEALTNFLDRRADDVVPAPSVPGAIFQNMNGYLWDQTVGGDNPQRNRVINAWKTALEMATAARDSIKDLTAKELEAKGEEVQKIEETGKKRKLTQNQKKLAVRQWIAKQYPAYTQMFAAAIDGDKDWNAAEIIYNRLDTVIKNVEDLNAVGRPRSADENEAEEFWHRNGLNLYFTRHEDAHHTSGEALCTDGTQAFVILAENFKEMQDAGGIRPDNKASIINFCKPFFEMPVTSELLQDLKDGKKSKDEICDLRAHDTTARVLLHEMTHIGWTLNLDPKPDSVGIEYVAQNAIVGGKQTKDKTNIQTPKFMNKNSGSAEMSDGYARFGVYSLLNALDECKEIKWDKDPLFAADCTDVWPRSESKWTKNSWGSYKKE